MGLRRLARQIRAGRRKAALAVGYAGYVEAETLAGRKPVGKRAWVGKIVAREIVNGEL